MVANVPLKGGGLFVRQYGFRTGPSTIDALREVTEATMVTQRGSRCSRPVLQLATLDVKNAFSSHRWNDVLNGLEYTLTGPRYILAMIRSYLSNRRMVYNTISGPRVKHITSGAAQGSILGLDLCDVNYNGILRKDKPEGTFWLDTQMILQLGIQKRH